MLYDRRITCSVPRLSGRIDIYKDRIKMFHVKDAEFIRKAGRAYGGYQSGWTAPGASARWVTDRSISRRSSRKVAANDFGGGRLSNGNAAETPQDGAVKGRNREAPHNRVTEKALTISLMVGPISS